MFYLKQVDYNVVCNNYLVKLYCVIRILLNVFSTVDVGTYFNICSKLIDSKYVLE